MDFSGEKYATFDEKGRVVLPADFKNEMGGKIPDGRMSVELDPYEKCINIYPMDVWEKRLSFFKSKLNRNNPQQSRLLDMIYRNFKVVTVAENCRMNFPNNFLNRVNITKDVVFIGRGDCIRLWDLQEYQKYDESLGEFGPQFYEHFGNMEV